MTTGEFLFLALVLTAFCAFAITLAYYTSRSPGKAPTPEPAVKETPKPPRPAAKAGSGSRVLEHA